MVGPSRAWAPEPARTRWRWRESVAGLECAASVAARALSVRAARADRGGVAYRDGPRGRPRRTARQNLDRYSCASASYKGIQAKAQWEPPAQRARKDAAGTPAS